MTFVSAGALFIHLFKLYQYILITRIVIALAFINQNHFSLISIDAGGWGFFQLNNCGIQF